MENINTQPTQCTQGMTDPRRLGRNNSGLNDSDISDLMCILHPSTPAAFKIVSNTAERAPQNVLYNDGADSYEAKLTQSMLEEQETFIIGSGNQQRALDLALRFSTQTRRPELGFVFGRHRDQCDIVLLTDTGRRISNLHFRIYVNESGVLMLADMSTNGTIVDDVVLKGKMHGYQQTRMLASGSVIQILSPSSDELIKFIVRIPSREGFAEQYGAKFDAYMQQRAAAEARAKADLQRDKAPERPVPQSRKTQTGNGRLQLVSNQWGMHWSGGDKYNVVGQIGKGAFATVYQVATKNDGQLYAAKELEKRKFMKNGVLDRKLDNEMQIMKSVSHPNIVQYVEYADVGNHLYIIMEFVPCGDLQQYLNLNGALPEALGKRMAYQVFDALDYLHQQKITHRDIKPDNILLADVEPNSFSIKLSDFGLSKVVQDNDTFLKTFCGTLLYCAPEVFPHYDAHVSGRKRTRRETRQQQQKFHSYSQSVDIWSFGAVLWFSLCLKPPFEGVADNTGRGMFEKIMGTPLEHGDLVKVDISDDAVALLAMMLNTDPASRPTPATCLHHKWFTGSEQELGNTENQGLVAISEEEEAEGEGHPDMSNLSLDEHESSQESEVSINSADIAFFDPRQSKRFKSDAFAYRNQDSMIDSSPDALFHNIPIGYRQGASSVAQSTPQKQRLFGEISQSALQSSSALLMRASEAAELSFPKPPTNTGDQGKENVADAHSGAERLVGDSQTLPRDSGAVASPSLLGAESMMREINMDSPDSPGHDPNEPSTPKTPEGGTSQKKSAGKNKGTPLSDATPRPLAQSTFNRQISLPIPASFYFDPDDPSTHNLEYASKVSGRDFFRSETSLPDTTGSLTENEQSSGEASDQQMVPTDTNGATARLSPSEFVKPPPRLGRLVSSADSFAAITINLGARVTSWGRAQNNTVTFPNKDETRVAKRALMIFFHAKGIEKLSEASDWLKLPDLHTVISTESSQGIWINGVELKKGDPGKMNFGRVYHGDEIVAWPVTGRNAGLKFKCEIFHGEGKEPRPEDGPRFVVETEGSSQKEKGKGKEREGMLAAVHTAEMAAATA